MRWAGFELQRGWQLGKSLALETILNCLKAVPGCPWGKKPKIPVVVILWNGKLSSNRSGSVACDWETSGPEFDLSRRWFQVTRAAMMIELSADNSLSDDGPLGSPKNFSFSEQRQPEFDRPELKGFGKSRS
jgi:hypothetical protein